MFAELRLTTMMICYMMDGLIIGRQVKRKEEDLHLSCIRRILFFNSIIPKWSMAEFDELKDHYYNLYPTGQSLWDALIRD